MSSAYDRVLVLRAESFDDVNFTAALNTKHGSFLGTVGGGSVIYIMKVKVNTSPDIREPTSAACVQSWTFLGSKQNNQNR